MEPITNFEDLLVRFRTMKQKKNVAVVSPNDEHTVDVVKRCLNDGLAKFHLVCDGHNMEAVETLAAAWPEAVSVHQCADADSAAAKGVELVRDGRAEVLMKGTINTDNLLRAVLNKECGLLPKGRVMTHASLIDVPGYDKLILFSDAAVIPRPNYEQFCSMLHYDIAICNSLGIEQPKAALIHFTEKVNDKFAHTLDYKRIREEAAEGMFGNAVVDGPMDVKTACDTHSAIIKGIKSPVAGHADILIFPTLEAGNTFYKTMTFFCHAKIAGIICGTAAPVVVPSRADSSESKFYSLALACLVNF